MPKRKAFGKAEKDALLEAVDYFYDGDEDPGYFGKYERAFCEAFNEYMGGGYTAAVATGTAALYVAIAALELPKGSHIVMSPITDPGSFNAAVLQGYKVSLADSEPGSFNTSWEQVEKTITPDTRAIVLVHCAGIPADIENISKQASQRGIRVIEDCSQAPGAEFHGTKVGGYGDIAALSTMYRKSLASGGSGGLVYCRSEELYFKVLAYGDRGKNFASNDYQERNAETYQFPALNWNTNELSCAIGIASLKRLDKTIAKRKAFCHSFYELVDGLKSCTVSKPEEGSSPFFLTVYVDEDVLNCSKEEFCKALLAEGVELNPHYRFVICQWSWATPYLTEHNVTPNAIDARDRSFNLYLNENYNSETANQIIKAITKVEAWFSENHKSNRD